MGLDSYLPLKKSGQSVIDRNLPYRFLRGQPLKQEGSATDSVFKPYVPDSSCAGMKTTPDRAPVHT